MKKVSKSFIFYPSFLQYCREKENTGAVLYALCCLGCGEEVPEQLRDITFPQFIHTSLEKYGRELYS